MFTERGRCKPCGTDHMMMNAAGSFLIYKTFASFRQDTVIFQPLLKWTEKILWATIL